jgi:CTP-dependent riboflavin kinase
MLHSLGKKKLEDHIEKMYEMADLFVEKLKQVDQMNIIKSVEESDERTKKLINELSEKDELQGKMNRNLRTENLKEFKTEFLKAFVEEDPEEFTKKSFLNVIKTSMIYLFNKYKRYINIDEYAAILGRMRNVNLMSLYDCCREIPPTKSLAGA